METVEQLIEASGGLVVVTSEGGVMAWRGFPILRKCYYPDLAEDFRSSDWRSRANALEVTARVKETFGPLSAVGKYIPERQFGDMVFPASVYWYDHGPSGAYPRGAIAPRGEVRVV